MIKFLVHYILCQDLCPDSMCAYIICKIVVTIAFCVFSFVITPSPHWRLLVYYLYFYELIIITDC